MNPGHSRTEVSNNGWDHQAIIRREQASRVMDEDLKPWDLYSLEGAEEPESPESMKNLFTRYRHIIQVLPSLVIDLGVAREVVDDQQLASVTAREIVGGTDSVGRVCRLLTGLILLDYVRNIVSQHTSRLPCVIRW
ncbi:unnamed protein product [Peronospora destructor]|uniref:Uncharacterized protein n=1 Tax=Peronospora destructor TaxID=86335 RepID=A0AAV0TLB6_9STRA|nr:unnamed protein product [Peronospora destructor]